MRCSFGLIVESGAFESALLIVISEFLQFISESDTFISELNQFISDSISSRNCLRKISTIFVRPGKLKI